MRNKIFCANKILILIALQVVASFTAKNVEVYRRAIWHTSQLNTSIYERWVDFRKSSHAKRNNSLISFCSSCKRSRRKWKHRRHANRVKKVQYLNTDLIVHKYLSGERFLANWVKITQRFKPFKEPFSSPCKVSNHK